jgi:iron complex transport system ATP-binding protein
MTSLRFNTATFGYGKRPVLTGLDLEVRAGEIVAVVGPNGVGKSTIIRAVSGVIPIANTQLAVDGRDLSQLSSAERARLIAVVPQAVRLPPAFTALEVVLMGRTPYLSWFDRESPADRAIALTAMERTQVVDLADRMVGELSGGEQQRIMVARALAQSAPILLLDEPTAHLDLRHQDVVLRLVRSLADDAGLAVLAALHDLNLVARFADRVALLSNGRLERVGEPEEVLTPSILAPVYGIGIQVVAHPVDGRPLVLAGGDIGRPPPGVP